MPEEDYLWFDIPRRDTKKGSAPDDTPLGLPGGKPLPTLEDTLFPIPAGPLHSVTIKPKTTMVPPGSEKSFTAQGFDDQGIEIDTPLVWTWKILSGEGRLEGDSFQIVFTAPQKEGVTLLGVEARRQERSAEASATIRIKEKISDGYTEGKGLPQYVLTPD